MEYQPAAQSRSKEFMDKGRFVIPNMITLTSMGFGLAAVFYVMRGLNNPEHNIASYQTAAWLVLLCTVLDKLDGTSARFLKAVSEFGMQLDSFSDFVAFGIAPSAVVFGLLFDSNLKLTPDDADLIFFYIGLIGFVFANAIRLARFNLTSKPGSTFMIGLPTTVAGGLLATYVLTGMKYLDSSDFFKDWIAFSPYLMIGLAMLMVSNLKLPKVVKRKNMLMNLWQVGNFALLVILVLTRSLPEVLLFIGTANVVGGFGYCIIFREKINQMIAQEETLAQAQEEGD